MKTINLNIVTPCARPDNLPLIATSILQASTPKDVTLQWMVILDDRFEIDVIVARRLVAHVPNVQVEVARSSGVAGHAQRNYALEHIRDGWIVFVDDDNLLHPDLPNRLATVIRGHPEAGAIAFDQALSGGIRSAAPGKMRVGGIDSAQVALNRLFVGKERFYVYAYSADGILIEKLHRLAPDRFIYLSEVLCTYNAITPDIWGETPPGRLSLGPLPEVHTAGSLHFHRSFSTESWLGCPGKWSEICLRSTLNGDRLDLTVPSQSDKAPYTLMRSPIHSGKQVLSGRVKVRSADSPLAGLCFNLRSTMRTEKLIVLRPEYKERQDFATTFEATENTELEIMLSKINQSPDNGSVTIEIDSLHIRAATC